MFDIIILKTCWILNQISTKIYLNQLCSILYHASTFDAWLSINKCEALWILLFQIQNMQFSTITDRAESCLKLNAFVQLNYRNEAILNPNIESSFWQRQYFKLCKNCKIINYVFSTNLQISNSNQICWLAYIIYVCMYRYLHLCFIVHEYLGISISVQSCTCAQIHMHTYTHTRTYQYAPKT